MEAIVIIILLVLALLLILAEMFVIGGVLGAVGAVLLVAATGLTFYYYGVGAGLLVLIASLGFTVAIVILGFRMLRSSKLGKRLFLGDATRKEEGFESADNSLEQYRNKTGASVSELHPAGLAEIEGERITVNTLGEFIEAGVPVEVIDIRYNQVVVRERID